MNPALILKAFLGMNLALTCSWAAFSLSCAIVFSRLKAPHRQLVRWAQVLLLASVILPAVLIAVPKRKLPIVDFATVRAASEGMIGFGGFRGLGARGALAASPISGHALARFETPGFLAKLTRRLDSRENGAVVWALFFALAAGFFCAFVRFSKRLLDLRRLLLSAALIRRIGRVRVVVADGVTIPFSAKLGATSWVVLPLGILENARDLRLAMRHELQHHRQGDTSWVLIAEALICVFYFNPFAYLWKRSLIELQEFSCDEALIGHRCVSARDYGSCLVRVAETALGSRQMHAGTSCMAAASRNPVYFKSFLRRRIEMLFNTKESRFRVRAGACVGTAALLLTVGAAYSAEQAMRGAAASPNPGTAQVNADVQSIAERALSDAIGMESASSGFAVVAEPSTGRILAVANIDTRAKKQGHWVLAERIEPESISKPLVVSAAIEKGLTTREARNPCENGVYQYGGRTYRDWKNVGWPSLTTEETVAYSSNICSIKIGEKLGEDGLRKMLETFGVGPDGTAKSYPEARSGVLPEADNGRQLVVPLVAIGSGYKITPIELMQAYGAIANGGNLMKPLQAGESDVQILRRVMSQNTSEEMKKILRQVVLKGTGKGHAASRLYTTAGKTASGDSFAGFIGFAPVSDPRIEVLVGIWDPKGETAHGATHAAPVFKRIVEDVLQYWKVPADQPQA